MTWREIAGRCALGFAVGNIVGFLGMAISDLLVFRTRRRP